MSKIRLQGNASGTGTLTIASPNTNSDTTVNLPSTLGNAGTSAMVTTDASGNLGLGVTPSAWSGTTSVLQNTSGALYSFSGGSQIGMNSNAFYNGSSWIYRSTSAASDYYQLSGTHIWRIAGSSAAGSPIAWTQAMTLSANGNLGIGETSPANRLHVAGNVTLADYGNIGATNNNAGISLTGGSTTNNGGQINLRGGSFSGNANGIEFVGGGTERMRIDSNGQLGVGFVPQSTQGNLQVYKNISGGAPATSGTTDANQVFSVNYTSVQTSFGAYPSGTGWIQQRAGGNFAVNYDIVLQPNGGNVGIGTSSPTVRLQVHGRIAVVDENIEFRRTGQTTWNVTNFGSNLFFNNGSDRMVLDSSGNLLVGTTSVPSPSGVSGQGLIVNNSSNNGAWSVFQSTGASSNRGIAVSYTGASPNDGFNEAYFFRDSTATRFLVKSNGGINNYSANNTNLSDRREKTNFAPAGEYLSKICAIPVQTFNYADQNLEQDPGLTLGVVAQDVQAVAPELVMESNWGTEEEPKMRLSIYQTDLQYALMKCIQEQQAIIEQLKADVAALKGA